MSKMQTVTQPEEQRLLDGMKVAVDLVDKRCFSPNAALEKVARDSQWTPGFLRAAVSAFNNGRQVAQWSANDSILEKTAEFALADYDHVHDAIWGGDEKKAFDYYLNTSEISPEYSRPPTFITNRESWDLLQGPLFEKAAVAPSEPEPSITAREAWDDYQWAVRGFEEKRAEYSHAHDKIRGYIGQLEEYFQKAAMDRIPFAVAEQAAVTYYGDDGRDLFNVLAGSFPREKRASDGYQVWNKPIDLHSQPFSLIRKTISAATDIYNAKEAMDQAYSELEDQADKLLPFAGDTEKQAAPDPLQTYADSLRTVRDNEIAAGGTPRNVQRAHTNYHRAQQMADESRTRARERSTQRSRLGRAIFGDKPAATPRTGLIPWVNKLDIGGIGKSLSGINKAELLKEYTGFNDKFNPVKARNKMWAELEDPYHENELRRIRAQSMLQGLMSDPESPVYGHDPYKVLKAYNEVSAISPRVAELPGAVESVLAQRLAGHTQPFENKELMDMEKTLNESRNPAEGRGGYLDEALLP